MKRDYTIAQAQGADGLRFIVNSMMKDGLIERTDKSALPHYRLTMAGYERLKKRWDKMVATPVKTGGEKVDRHIKAAEERLRSATFEEEFQQVGLLCREALISLAQALYDPERHPTPDGVKPSRTDTKRMLEAVIAAQLPGESNEEARALARSAVRLALALQHDRAADRRIATLCYESTTWVIRLAAVLSEEGSKPPRLTSRARRVPRRHDRPSTRRARSAAAPRLSLEATRCHAGRMTSPSAAPRAPAASPRARPDGGRRPGGRATAQSRARPPSRRTAGRPGAAPSVASCSSPAAGRPADVAPGTRPAETAAPKGRLSSQAARRVPRLFAPLP